MTSEDRWPDRVSAGRERVDPGTSQVRRRASRTLVADEAFLRRFCVEVPIQGLQRVACDG